MYRDITTCDVILSNKIEIQSHNEHSSSSYFHYYLINIDEIAIQSHKEEDPAPTASIII